MLAFRREGGQGLVEYALILVMVALIVIVILAMLGPAIGNVFSNLISLI
jgi:pilus assembly protein Flp/PilA